MHHHVRKQQGEGFVAHELAGAPDGVSETQRFLLAGKAGLSRAGKILLQKVEFCRLAPLAQRRLQFVLLVEVILDDTLVAPGDEDEMLDSRLAGLIHRQLDDRPVHHRQHLLRHGLGGRQEARSKPGHGKDGCPNRTCHEFTPD